MSKDELSKYITDPGYRIQGMPGVCFAFAVNQTDEGFEAEIMIND
jgi:ATP-binding cassette, subfamily A (ABC1), member 3